MPAESTHSLTATINNMAQLYDDYEEGYEEDGFDMADLWPCNACGKLIITVL